MRVFVLGTGRCGTVTFSKACQEIMNFTSSHELKTSFNREAFGCFEFSDNHIEIDPRLSYHYPILKQKYPEAYFFHLKRNRKDCVSSLSKRRSLQHYSVFHYGWFNGDYNKAAEIYYDNTTTMLESFINDTYTLHLENLQKDFTKFCKIINANYDYKKTEVILERKYNKT